MPKLTIVIPTYNVESYIRTCLDSLVNQTSHDFTALVINDGSPANEQPIIDSYTQAYPFIRSFIKTNGGYGSVLNLALSMIDTPYFLICDPDDYLREDAVESLIGLMENNDVDLVVGAKQLVYADNQETAYDPSYNADFAHLNHLEIYTKGSPEFDQLFFMEPSPHAKLYKTQLIRSIRFPEKVSYTDNLLYYIGLLKSRRVIYTREAYSFYLINREGNTRTDLRPAVMDHWIRVLVEILEQSRAIPDIPDMFYFRMFEAFKFVFNKIDFIKADPEVLRSKLFGTQEILGKLLPHAEAIIPVYMKLAKVNRKERNHDLSLLSQKGSSTNFKRLAERKLYTRLHGEAPGILPKLKRVVKTHPALSRLYGLYHDQAKYLYAARNPKVTLGRNIRMRVIDETGTTFFGYYNQSPYRNGHYVYHRILSNSLSLDQRAEICLDQKVISHTVAWNWQQGSMLQWLDDRHIIHNDFEDKRFCSKIIDVETGFVRTLDFPIYAVAKNQSFALSLNFSRLAKYRPDYGYFNLPLDAIEPFDAEDGIFYIDIEKNTRKLLISFETLKALKPTASMEGAAHKVNHIDLSPNDQAFIFLYRWLKDGKKYTRLIRCDLATLELEILADNDMVSHCFWKDDSTIIGYLRDQSFGDRYYQLGAKKEVLFKDQLVDDGHPSFSADGNLFITDSYPDYTCTQKLYLSRKPFTSAVEIARFYSGRRYSGTKRCDLHPRFSPGLPEVTFDSVFSGRRQLVAIDLSEVNR